MLIVVIAIVVVCMCMSQAPGRIAPLNGERDRYLVQQSLNHTASEIHTAIGSLFNPAHNEHTRAFNNVLIQRRLTFLENHVVKDRSFVVGSSLSIADLYLYIVLSWSPYVGVDLSPYPAVRAYFEGIRDHEAVKAGHAQIAANPSRTN